MKTAIVLGTFDGLHAGHRAVIQKADGFFGIAVTFDIPPKSFFAREPQLLILPDERARRIKELGINQVEMQKFQEIKDIPADEYLVHLKQKYNPQRIVCGFNYKFGRGAEGDSTKLAEFCKQNDIEFICVPPVTNNGEVVSSTHIRNLIREGDIARASQQIYGGFSFKAPVLHGDARGRQLGFPTANQQYPDDLIVVKYGVYVSRVVIDKKEYKAITNIGVRPTFKTETVGCETFIKDFSDDIYGKEMEIQLLDFVRGEKKFDSALQLKDAILEDIKFLD